MKERGKHAAHAVAQPRVKVVQHQLGAVAAGARVALQAGAEGGRGASGVACPAPAAGQVDGAASAGVPGASGSGNLSR